MRHMLRQIALAGAVLLMPLVSLAAEPVTTIAPGQEWLDDQGQPINAHGGGVLHHGDRYYWYGEIKQGQTYLPECNASWGGTRVDVTGVSCYSSTDLVNWHNEGNVLPAVDDADHDLHRLKVVERPKVIYNQATGKFVMWMHIDSMDYAAASCGVAVSDSPTGPFEYLHSFRPNQGVWPRNATAADKAAGHGSPLARDIERGQMARDMTLFVDDDNRAYQFYASEENATLHVSLLTDDYLRPAGEYARIFVGRSMEAPAVFKRQGKYYLIASGCTGWLPNPARSAVADSIWGPWRELGNPCRGEGSEITFESQSTFALKLAGADDAYIFLADRWNKDDLTQSQYVWLPIVFDQQDRPTIPWRDEWAVSEVGGGE